MIKAVILGMALMLVAGCNDKGADKPLLTREAFVAAVAQCGAQEAEFIERTDGRAPSISFVDSEVSTAKASRTSECLAEAFKTYRLESMIIRSKPVDGAAR